MEIIVHRGSHQIGGCATEIKTKNARIIIDFGLELDSKGPEPLHVPGVTDTTQRCDGVFFTHYHGDHIGLMDTIVPNVPLFIGRVAKELLILSNQRQHLYDNEQLQSVNTFEAGESLIISEMTITPYFVDHSAIDSYMLLIEAEGKKVLHTGDFRSHGFKGKGLIKTIEAYIGHVDALICEGTTLNRNTISNMTEHELSYRAKGILKNHKYIFVVCASTNIDRLAAFQAAVPQGRYCICDGYQKDVLNLIQDAYGKLSPLYQFSKTLTYGSNLEENMTKLGFCMFVRLGNPRHRKIMERYKDHGAVVVYSMWEGYLNDSKTKEFLAGFPMEKLHTSGHANISTLKLVIDKTVPKMVIPIHTQDPSKLKQLLGESLVLSIDDKEIITL